MIKPGTDGGSGGGGRHKDSFRIGSREPALDLAQGDSQEGRPACID